MNEKDRKLLETRRVSNAEHMDKNLDDAVHLFFTNNEVVRHNETIIAKLEEEAKFQKVLILKKGAKVIHNHNVDLIDGLVNGVTGTIIGFSFGNPQESKKDLPGANISSCI